MGVKTIDLNKKKISLETLLEQVKGGTEIVLVKDKTPLARITPEPTAFPQRTAGLNEGALIYISDDFDEPLPEAFWLGDES